MTGTVEGTGRYLVLLEDDAADEGARTMTRVAGLRTASTADIAGESTAVLPGSDGLVLHDLGVAVVVAGADQVEALTRATRERGPIAFVERERTVHAIATAPTAPPAPPAEVDETTFTWGLQAVGAPDSPATGAGMRVAVLDTGFDAEHPDFAGRVVESRSFVPGEEVSDGHGHGTHCIGTACGPREPDTGPGYGVAYEAEIYVGKVLSNAGSGTDGGILAGIAWAIGHGCPIVSMSLGAPVRPGDPHSPVFERVARRAVARGTLLIAAAGNESSRRAGRIAPVGHPANCPSIMAVGAVDAHGEIADFSCGSVDPERAVDVVGPGVDVHSAWPMPARHRTISGTSMATPHVAGVAALLAQHHNARGWELWARLGQSAHRSPLPSTDVGAGLVRAPR
ncbi:Serine protease, subtilisin family [Amycolatopsis arida]|uniref:Serine protease, subtilisin family n=1 Tax=Amycolatopsis arida TaxID=587909 RepID=A0A1I5ZI74_9PSEU|nr:S8 family serine peptidase [Amycolatopsis arida]TDX89701.1 subtilisin family serine protease [Amycolatopsis arida]SFQ56141.1 Serine protease, subtilisin family [Amycolatopsis arida]